MRSRPLLAVAVLLLAAACGGDDAGGAAVTTSPDTAPATTQPDTTEDAPETTPPDTSPETTAAPATTTPTETTTTTEAPPQPVRFDEAGPFPVGVTTLQLATGPAVEVWYPAVEGTVGTDTYDVRDFTPEAIQELLTGDVSVTFTIDAGRDADVADETFPLVLFSHGSSGFRLQSSFLTSHLASHGMIVVAPDHPSRDLMNALGGRDESERTDPVDDLLGALDLILDENATEESRFAGRVDDGRIAAIGHSAGGGTILAAASDERIGSYVSMAAGGPGETSDFPDVPSLFMAGATDEIVTPIDRTRPAFESAPGPTWYVEIAETGHNGFDDFCTFGGGTGIIGIAEASGLGPLLDAQPQLRRLGEDGCVPPAAPVELAFPIISHTATSFLRWVFDIDAAPTGLDADTFAEFELDVVLEER